MAIANSGASLRATYVPPMGPRDARIAIVGEQPGRNEVRRPHLGPFSGPAGENLKECMAVAGIPWDSVYRTNVIKDLDAPLDKYVTFTTGKNRQACISDAGTDYVEVLRSELAEVNPNVVVACGNVALWALTSRIGITVWRGSVVDSTLNPGRKVIPTFHPATWTQEKLRENPSAYLNRYLVVLDLKRALVESTYPEIRGTPRELITAPTFDQARDFITQCMYYGERGAVIDYDIETTKTQELSCIGLTWSREFAMCIPFVGPQCDYFTPEQESTIMGLLNELFTNPWIRKGGQNVIFDSHFLLKRYGIRTHNLECTMVAQGILWPEMRKSLEFITSVWTDLPYYKADGKVFLSGVGSLEKGWQYNCLDVLSTSRARPRQLAELTAQGNLGTYERQRKLIPPLTYMMEHGIRVDREGMARAADAAEHEALALSERVSAMLGRSCIVDANHGDEKRALNLSSSRQLQAYFYDELGLQPYVNPKTGAPTMDETALTRLANKGHNAASLILKARKLMKRRSTFLDVSGVDSDGRMRCQYNPVGTKFGRISSSSNIFGTGTNLQNVPHEVLTHFLADPGYVLYSLDKAQIENHIVAYVGNITPMIEAFERGDDLHRLTAARTLTILGVPRTIDTVASDERQDYGKRPNHAFNYGYGYRSYALKYEVPEALAKRVHTAYHTAYPQLRGGYWAYVQRELKARRSLTTLLGRVIPFLGYWSDTMLNEAYSAIPQSTCGDLVNERGLSFIYYNEAPHFRCVELLTQVHDSIEFQMPLSVPLEEHARVLIDVKRSLEIPLEFQGRQFVVPTDLVVGRCMNKELGVEIKAKAFIEDEGQLVRTLRAALERLGLSG